MKQVMRSMNQTLKNHLATYGIYFSLTFCFVFLTADVSVCQSAQSVTFEPQVMLRTDYDKAKEWKVDAVHSKVKFSVTHLVISEVEGSFDVYDGTIKTKQEDFQNAEISFSVDAKSINTENKMRDDHLRSADFFDVSEYSTLKFKSTSFKKIKKNKYKLKGTLTIKDITKEVTFDVVYGGTAKDGYGNTKAGFKATTTIDRYAYGLKWNSMTEAGGLTVGQEIDIVLNLQFALAQ